MLFSTPSFIEILNCSKLIPNFMNSGFVSIAQTSSTRILFQSWKFQQSVQSDFRHPAAPAEGDLSSAPFLLWSKWGRGRGLYNFRLGEDPGLNSQGRMILILMKAGSSSILFTDFRSAISVFPILRRAHFCKKRGERHSLFEQKYGH